MGPELSRKGKRRAKCHGERNSVVSALHDGAATSLLLGGIGILALVNLGNGIVSLGARDEEKKPGRIPVPIRMEP